MLSDYDIEIRHIKGSANGRADALSRRPDYDQGTEDNANITVLPDSVFVRTIEVVPEELSQDNDIIKPWVDPHNLKRISGVWYKDSRRVVSCTDEGKRELIKQRHDPPVYGHPGISKTVQLLERSYWWPKMRQEIAEYVKGCAECQRMKVNNRPTKAPLQPIYPRPEALPFETIVSRFGLFSRAY